MTAPIPAPEFLCACGGYVAHGGESCNGCGRPRAHYQARTARLFEVLRRGELRERRSLNRERVLKVAVSTARVVLLVAVAVFAWLLYGLAASGKVRW